MAYWVPWADALEMAAGTAAIAGVTGRSRRPRAKAMAPYAQELTVILGLYALWQYAGAFSIGKGSGAVARGRWIWNAERALHVPSEAWFQHLVLGHRHLVQLLNLYYVGVHVPALFGFLVWLFVRHRERYKPVRTVIALVTGASLLIALITVAPPRLVPGLGMVDTGHLFGPTVYAGGASPGIDQLSAMPSLHVGWAVLVAAGVVWAGTSRWRWVFLAHPVITVFCVVATGNHYWADVAAALALCALFGAMVAWWHWRRRRRGWRESPTDEPGLALVEELARCKVPTRVVDKARLADSPGRRRVRPCRST
ncbi:MAG: phosphatase PAP2 family protein [Acidimicrobiales bacterium]